MWCTAASTVPHPSTGSSSCLRHSRPLSLNRSETGGRPLSWRISTACISSLLAPLSWHTFGTTTVRGISWSYGRAAGAGVAGSAVQPGGLAGAACDEDRLAPAGERFGEVDGSGERDQLAQRRLADDGFGLLNDFITGYLGAAGATAALISRATEGGSHRVKVSLTRTGMFALSLGTVDPLLAGISHEHQGSPSAPSIAITPDVVIRLPSAAACLQAAVVHARV